MNMQQGVSVAQAPVAADEGEELRKRVRGPVFCPGDPGYDEARAIWNAMIDKRPAYIVRCRGVADILAALDFARSRGLPLAVRSGGHNIAGTALCDGGIVIDLSALKGMRVDPAARTVAAQPGLTWGELDAETQAFGYAVPGGIVSTTGIAGLTLGGGFGWLSRKYGYTCDNLLAVDVVTADGEYLTASEEAHADLFWAMRGGGGNFGIATSFLYRLHPLGPTVTGGLVLYPMAQAAEVIDFFRTFTASAPDELTSLLVLRIAPPAPFLPAAVHGQPVAGIAVCYAGSVGEGATAIQPLKQFGSPLVDLTGPKPFHAIQTMFDAAQPPGRYYYWKSEYLRGLSPRLAGTLITHCADFPSPQSSLLMMHLGGAIRRVPDDATAAGHRDGDYIIHIGASWLTPQAAGPCIAWARDFWQATLPDSTGGVYVNFLTADEGQERVKAAYGAAKYARLAALKQRYDPTNLFHANMNIRPAG
jgi:FAD/FMN-containing dehydrogenase